jgi:hypothetical protein
METSLSADLAARLRNPELMEELLLTLAPDPAIRYELLFHSAFAAKLFQVMQKPESRNQGFDRMQQSFREAVEKVRAVVRTAGERGFSAAPALTELSAQGMSRLLELVNDLALVKQSEVGHE